MTMAITSLQPTHGTRRPDVMRGMMVLDNRLGLVSKKCRLKLSLQLWW